VNSLNLLPREMFHLDHVDSYIEKTGFLWQKSIKYHQATEPNGISMVSYKGNTGLWV